MSHKMDPKGKLEAALSAERSVLEHYGLDAEEHSVQVPEFGLKIRVLDVGEGDPVILVPGGSGEALPMFPLMAELSGYRMFAVNRPGAAGSTPIDYQDVDVREVAVRVLSTVQDHLGIDKAPFIGTSMGGLWSFWMALDETDRVTGVVQGGCPALMLDTSVPLPMRLMTLPIIMDLLFPLTLPDDAASALEDLGMMGSPQQSIEALPHELGEAHYQLSNLESSSASLRSMLQATLTLGGANPRYRMDAEDLRKISQPVLFIWGERDPFGAPDVGRRAVDIMDQARLEILDAGHIPYLDRPGDCAELIVDFLSTL